MNHCSLFDKTTRSSDLDATRQAIYQFADAIFSANESDVKYFSGNGVDDEETVVLKCSSLMPCIHGCDAHENSKIFEPDANRYCWIKADSTFNGLRQIFYEPTERVKISELKPEEKQRYYVIDKVEIEDSDFQKESIYFNENLTCIIGGKSTGKSTLLKQFSSYD